VLLKVTARLEKADHIFPFCLVMYMVDWWTAVLNMSCKEYWRKLSRPVVTCYNCHGVRGGVVRPQESPRGAKWAAK